MEREKKQHYCSECVEVHWLVHAVCREETAGHTQATAELLEVDQAVLVLIQQPEGPQGEEMTTAAVGPGSQEGEEAAELLLG